MYFCNDFLKNKFCLINCFGILLLFFPMHFTGIKSICIWYLIDVWVFKGQHFGIFNNVTEPYQRYIFSQDSISNLSSCTFCCILVDWWVKWATRKIMKSFWLKNLNDNFLVVPFFSLSWVSKYYLIPICDETMHLIRSHNFYRLIISILNKLENQSFVTSEIRERLLAVIIIFYVINHY